MSVVEIFVDLDGILFVCFLTRELFVYVLNPCGLVKVIKKKYCQNSRTKEQIACQEKLVRRTNALVNSSRKMSRKTCSSVQGLPNKNALLLQVTSVQGRSQNFQRRGGEPCRY